MPSDIDLRDLAVRRDLPGKTIMGPKRQVWSRYVIPAVLFLGFLTVVGWAGRDMYLPRIPVTVVPVFATKSEMHKVGTPLFKAAGWVEPRPTPIRVAALASGVVKELLVVEDQEVKKGQAVAYLVDQDAVLARDAAKAKEKLAEAELKQVEAELEAAETNFKYPVQLEASAAEAKADLAKVETMLAQLPFELKKAEAQWKFATQELDSKKKAGTVVAAIELDRAQSKVDEAKAWVDDLNKRQETLGNESKSLSAKAVALAKKLKLKSDEKKALGEAQARKEAAQAKVQEASVALAEAELRLERMVIVAPADGRVLQLVAVPGASVTAGIGPGSKSDASTVITMYQPKKLQLRVDVRFDDLPNVVPGQPVRIDSPALAAPLGGKVLFISSLVNIQKNTVEVKVAIDSPPSLLKPEMLMDCTFLAPEQPKGAGKHSEQLRLFLPKQLVHNGDSGPFVWLADTYAGVARKQPVEIGPPAAGGTVEVLKGLNVSSKVIASGLEGLQDGSRIQIMGEDKNLGVEGP
jgi:RND family efflux transporter MFP subunit